MQKEIVDLEDKKEVTVNDFYLRIDGDVLEIRKKKDLKKKEKIHNGHVCTICGHVNEEDAQICKMCSNYLFTRKEN